MRAIFICAAVVSWLGPINAQSPSNKPAAPPADDSEARPPVTKADLEIVNRAQKLLDAPAKWNRADNRQCPTGAKTFSFYCALEMATYEVTGSFAHRGAAMQEARFVIEEVVPDWQKYDHRLMDYNNDPKTTFADIQNVFLLLRERIKKRLVEESPAPAGGPDVVRFKGAIDNVKYVFGVAPPVAHAKPGNILEANSLDCFGNALQKPGDSMSLVKGDNPLTGPFYIEGAEPGDTLVVRILDLQVDGKQGVGTFSPGFGAVNATHYTPVLERQPLPERIWFYPIDKEKNTATFQALDSDFKVSFPLHPFLGCIGVAPANGEARSSLVPAEFGGNMDAPEASAGNTLYFPVNVPGALFYFGDGHAAMGDGEVAGSAVEVPMRARLQFDLVKGKSTGWPRFENEKEIMTAGIYRPVDDAVRIAVTELIHWIHADYGLSELDAYELLSKVGKLHLAEMVDPNYVDIASIEKKYLPAKTR